MQCSQDIFKKPEFWAKFDLFTPITKDQKFSKKFRFSNFSSFTVLQLHAKFRKNWAKRSLEIAVADGRTDGRTDGTEFIGPLSALPGVQKPITAMNWQSSQSIGKIVKIIPLFFMLTQIIIKHKAIAKKKNFMSILLTTTVEVRHQAEAYLEPSRTSTMDLFCKNS